METEEIVKVDDNRKYLVHAILKNLSKKKRSSKMESTWITAKLLSTLIDSPLSGLPASGISKVYYTIYSFVNIVI